MDQQTSSNNDGRKHRYRQRLWWGFSYWGGTSALEAENGLSKADFPSSSYPLSQARIGAKVLVISFSGLDMGLIPGTQIRVISVQPSGSAVIALDDKQMGLGRAIASRILVSDEPLSKQQERGQMLNNIRTYLREMPVATVGRVVGYDKALSGYKGKLISMGLTPGTEFTVIHISESGEFIKINVHGLNFILRKHEADALVIEEVN